MRIPGGSRRLVSQCLVQEPQTMSHTARQMTLTHQFHHKSSTTTPKSTKPNPILDEYKRKNAIDLSVTPIQPAMPAAGDIAPSSIFEDDRRIHNERLLTPQPNTPAPNLDSTSPASSSAQPERNPAHLARVLNPAPGARERWERNRVVSLVRRNGRVSRAFVLARTEREHLVRSPNFKTSVKKLGMLARQIAGKTLDDAILQMRFSKKGVAVKVREQLEAARDEAVVMRGMGLGESDDGEGKVEGKEEGKEIRLKDGSRHVVKDPKTIYIDQAWVGRGPYGQLPDYRARGRVFVMRTPWTSLSVVLKEEATRLRQFAEREEKDAKKRKEKVWKHLPDRPIQVQRQWYSW